MIDPKWIPAIAFIVFGVLAIASQEGKQWATTLLVTVAVLVIGFLLLGAWGALEMGLTP